jgi:hypothetical protein
MSRPEPGALSERSFPLGALPIFVWEAAKVCDPREAGQRVKVEVLLDDFVRTGE